MQLKYLKTRDVKDPQRGTPQSAGVDFFVPQDFESLSLKPGESVCIPAGIKVRIPENHALVFFNKSGVAVKKSLTVGACVIDEDYQGEVHIDVHNIGENHQIINPGDKIIQGLVLPVDYSSLEEVYTEGDLFANMDSERGTGGFGSTGTK